MRVRVPARRHQLLLSALCVVVALGLAGCGSTALLSRTTTFSAATLDAHQTFGGHNRSCLAYARPSHQLLDYGSPSQSMLSSFAVLKLPAKAALPYGGFRLAKSPFVNYIRVAQRRFDWPFKVIPTKDIGGVSSHCLALEGSAVRASVAHAPAKIRAGALQIEQEVQLDGRYILRHPEGICVSGYHGAAFCEPLLFALVRGGLSLVSSGRPDQVVFCLVPDGVARVTARYPGAPARGITVSVVNNLAVWKMTGQSGSVSSAVLGPTILWRAANGRVIRRIAPQI
jgi:hypothetical protein